MITQEEIQKAYASAPKHLQEYIDSDDLFNAFHEIRGKYNLHLDKAGDLAIAIDAIILNLQSFDAFPRLLKEALGGVDEKTYQGVVEDVNTKIFTAFRELTKKQVEKLVQAPAPPKPVSNSEPLKVIEQTVSQKEPAPVKPLQIIQEKMSQTVGTAALNIPVPPVAAAVTTPAAQPEQKPPATAPTRYHGADPYREPAE